MQPVIILLIGMILGKRLGIISVLIWIMLGCFGLPVFAGGRAGAIVLIGPTGGFIIGYLACVYIIGYVTEKFGDSYRSMLLGSLTGQTILYALGLLGFMLSFKYFLQTPMTLDRAISLAIAPFALKDFIQTFFVVYLGVKVRRTLLKAGYVVAK